MVVLLVTVGALWFRGRALADAQTKAGDSIGHDHHHGSDTDPAARTPWRERARSRAGWADAATYTISDLTMLRKEMVIGFTVAGFLATLVPVHAWNDVFLHGHGAWTIIENALVGPLVAIISFVCSVGNVPLAAAPWKGGISFGGVIAFVFADLITLPLLLIYRNQYGRRMAVRMLAVFWAVMSGAGLITEALFRALGWIPTSRPTVVAGDTFRLDCTTVLDVVALVGFAVPYWLYRNRDRLDGGNGYAKDPVCGMTIEVRHAPASTESLGTRSYFCSEHCRDRFEGDPDRYVSATPSAPSHPTQPTTVGPIRSMPTDPAHTVTQHAQRSQVDSSAPPAGP